MRALSIRQPFAHAIVAGDKQIENRRDARGTPPICRYRGPLLIHASSALATRGQISRAWPAEAGTIQSGLPRGGIVGRVRAVGHLRPDGSAELEDGVLTAAQVQRRYDLSWWLGGDALLLDTAEPLPFVACRGQLGIWRVPAVIYRRLP